jgi:hypothetical protein
VIIPFEPGNYSFLANELRPFSLGVLADPGFGLVHAVLANPRPLEEGFDVVSRHLEAVGRPVTALAAAELRIPRPFSMSEFDGFNEIYAGILSSHNLTAGRYFPLARTNIAVGGGRVPEPALYAFTYTVPGNSHKRAWRMSGTAGRGDGTVQDAFDSVIELLTERLTEIGADWAAATAVNLYTNSEHVGVVTADNLRLLGPAGLHGLHWYPGMPPVTERYLEIDVRSVGEEIVV